MLSLDLFASPYEKPLHEGAVDDLEQRRIHDLNMKMLDLLDRAKEPNYKKNPDALAGLKREFQKVKAERDSYFGINPKTGMHPSGLLGTTKGKLDEIEPQKVPAKNQDLVTPQQRVANATPPATTMLGKAKETFSSFVDWLAGREDKGPTYESVQVNENNPNSAINSAKYAYEQMRKAHDDNVDIATIRWMGTGEPITMSRNQLYHTLQKLQAMSRQNRNAFALQVLADRNNFYLWLGGQKKVTPRPQLKQPTDPFQPELPLGKPSISPVQERDQKKKPSDVATGDVKVARELQKIRAKYPAALSDIEALARNEIDSTERANQQLNAIRGANEKQDELLKKLVDLDREQGREIDNLDSENNGLEQQLARIQATNDRLQQTVGQMTGTKRSTRTPSKPITKEPSASVASVEIDPVALKKVQDLETQIQQIQAKPKTPDTQEEISNLERRLSALTAAVAGKKKDAPQPKTFGDLEVGITPAKAKSINPASRIKVPAGDLDMPQTIQTRGKKSPSPKDDDFDILSMPATSSPGVQPSTASMIEHGGGIGPRQHWQDLMQETVADVKAGMAQIYRRLAPKIERHRDSFLAGQLYDELENYAELHGAEREFKQMMNSARNRAHMEYDTNPGGFHNWFWFLPFEDNTMTEGADDIKKRMSKLEALALAANRAGDDAKCKMYQQKIQSLKQKLSQSMAEGWSDAMVAQRTGRPRTPYSVYIKGKKWKDFENDDHARAVMDKLKAKFKADGRDPSVITIAPTDIPESAAEEQKPAGWGEFPPKQEITIVPPKKLKSGQTYQDQNKYWQSQGQAPIYKTNEEKEPTTRQELLNRVDKIQRMMTQERNPANLQILRKELEMLKQRYQHLKEEKTRLDKTHINLTESKTYKLWESAGRKIVEAQLTAAQIQQIFQQAEQGATAAGTNRTGLGQVKDASGAVAQAWEQLKTKVANSGPVKNVDAYYDQAAEKLRQATGGDQGVMRYVEKYRTFAKAHPIAQSLIYSALIAAAGISGAGAGGAAALALLKLTDKLLQGEKFSSAAYSGAKTGALAYGASLLKDLMSGTQGVTTSVEDPEWEKLRFQGDLVSVNQVVTTTNGTDTFKEVIQSIVGPNAKGEYLVRIVNNDDLREFVTKTPPPSVATGATESKKYSKSKLTETQIKRVFQVAGHMQDQLNEGMWDNVKNTAKGLANKAAGAVVNKAQTIGTNLTNKVTADKLMTAWKKAGSPLDSEQVKAIMKQSGVADNIITATMPAQTTTAPVQRVAAVNPTQPMPATVAEDQDTSGVERAILNRIMVAHTDLLMKYGTDKVMQAAEEVAYNVGDVDEIGTSDVSAYVQQVKQILGATP